MNLDPANDGLPYEVSCDACTLTSSRRFLALPSTNNSHLCQCAVNIADLVSLDAVQRDLGLGPNGGLVYAMEYVAANLDWLQDRVQPLLASGTYLLFDCPGQVELFNVHDALHKIVLCLTDKLRIRCARALMQLRSESAPDFGLTHRLSVSLIFTTSGSFHNAIA